MLNIRTIFKLPDGYILWPGVIFKKTPEGNTPVTHDKVTLQCLAAIYSVKDSLPEGLRPAAEGLIEAALAELSKEHGNELTIFIRPPNWGRDDFPPGNR
jgi:hypothetical protein